MDHTRPFGVQKRNAESTARIGGRVGFAIFFVVVIIPIAVLICLIRWG